MSTPRHLIAPENLTLDGVVAWHASRQPESIALEPHNEKPITWEWLARAVQGTAEELACKIARGEIVGIVCEDSIEFHVLLNALWRCGAKVLLISRTWGANVVTDLVRLTGVSVIFCTDSNWLPYVALKQRVPFPLPRLSNLELSPPNAGIDDIALIASTSGTTENPKCVAIRHRQIRAAYRTALMVHDFSNIRQAASLFPLNGIGVLGVCFLFPREVGVSTRIYPPFSLSNIQRSWHDIITREVDFIYLVPPLVRMLGALPQSSFERSCRVLAFCASAPVAQDELRRLEERFPVRVFNVYGLTEMTFAVFFGCREDDDYASGSIGYPCGIEARLLNNRGEPISGSGKGELLLRGPMLTDGYLHNSEATQMVWKNGWLHTGDLAERDTAGRYYICGRLKDAVIRGGVLTYFYELEHYLSRAPGVVDAIAFKGRDLPSGDELCVVVQACKPISRNNILAWIREHVGLDKVPNALFVWDGELPRNSNGKVMRQTLSELHRSGGLR